MGCSVQQVLCDWKAANEYFVAIISAQVLTFMRTGGGGGGGEY